MGGGRTPRGQHLTLGARQSIRQPAPLLRVALAWAGLLLSTGGVPPHSPLQGCAAGGTRSTGVLAFSSAHHQSAPAAIWQRAVQGHGVSAGRGFQPLKKSGGSVTEGCAMSGRAWLGGLRGRSPSIAVLSAERGGMGASASNGSAPTSVPSPLEARASTVGQRGPQGGGGRTFLAWVAGAFIPRQVSAFCSSIFNFPPRRSAIAPLDTQRSGGTFLPTASGRRGVAVGGANALGESDSPSTVAAVKPLSSGAAVESLPQNPAAAPPVVSERRNRKGKLKNGGKGSGQKKQEQVVLTP
ncbi:hypothetical protein T484DRAFT_3018796 [Baffinella frigidus]|nr:hypothetical protein T484DRAFT_3018796 [Cryptophyta sp. CCMP2293]